MERREPIPIVSADVNHRAGKCEVVRVGPDIFSVVLTGVGILRAEPGETAFGKTGEG